MRRTYYAYIILVCILMSGCIGTMPMHDPIFPAANSDISYTFEAGSSSGIEEVRLYETVSFINSAGTVTSGSEVLLEEWNFPSTQIMSASHTLKQEVIQPIV